MVLDDVYRGAERRSATKALRTSSADGQSADAPWEKRMAAPVDRMAAAIADVAFFAPAASLAMAPFRREALLAQLTASRGDWIAAAAGAGIALLAAGVAYQAFFVAWMGATPGKKLFGLRVVSIWDGRNLRAGPSLVRAVAMGLEALALGAPWLAIFSNEKRRPLHDRVGDSAVVVAPGRSPVGAPTPSEAGTAAGIFAALLAVGAAVGLSVSGELATALRESEDEARELEDRGMLCAAAADLRAEWPEGSRPSRLEAALALAAAGLVDQNCLYKEADREAWKRSDRRALAYAAKAIARADDPASAEAYANKACAGEDAASDACLIARLAGAQGARDEEAEAEARRQPRAEAGGPGLFASVPEADVELLNRALRDPPVYVAAFAIRRRMELRDYSAALDLIANAPVRRGLAPFYESKRARALWALGRLPEARSSWTSSIASAAPDERIELRKDRCSFELERGCAEETRRACASFVEDAAQATEALADHEAAVAFVRGGECAEGLAWSAKAAKSAMPSEEGKAYVDAIERARSGNPSAAKEALKAYLATASGGDPMTFDAQARLAALASTVAEAEEIRGSWQKSEFDGDAWSRAGRVLMRRFLELGAPKKALAAGLALRDRDPFNSEIGKTVVVAAYRSGDSKAASELLAAVEDAAAFPESAEPLAARAPASAAPPWEGEYDRIASELRRKTGVSRRKAAAP